MGGNNGRAITFTVPLILGWVCQQGIDVIAAKCNSWPIWAMVNCAIWWSAIFGDDSSW